MKLESYQIPPVLNSPGIPISSFILFSSVHIMHGCVGLGVVEIKRRKIKTTLDFVLLGTFYRRLNVANSIVFTRMTMTL